MEILAGAEAHVRVGILLGAADFVGSRDVMLLRHRAKGRDEKNNGKTFWRKPPFFTRDTLQAMIPTG